MTISMTQLECELTDALDADKADILADSEPQDRLHEYCDSVVPIYNYDLAMLLASDLSLAYPDDCPFIHEADVNVFKVIGWSVYERLLPTADEWLTEAEAGKKKEAE